MSSKPANQPDYSFEHGIDHCGYGGVAPILYIGGPATRQDFFERDLTEIRGVSISQNGLPQGTKWADLNLAFLFEALPKIEYLRILFEDAASLEDIGDQPALRELNIDCPKARGMIKGEMAFLTTAKLRWPDKCTANLDAPNLTQLSLLRPHFESLSSVAHLPTLRQLEISYARNLRSLSGLEGLPELERLRLQSCPNLADLDSVHPQNGPRHLVIHGCAGFNDASGVLNLASLEDLCIQAGEQGPHQVRLPRAASHSIRLDLRGVAAVWI
jgi:Leucine-rich repeat (LRR) protein